MLSRFPTQRSRPGERVESWMGSETASNADGMTEQFDRMSVRGTEAAESVVSYGDEMEADSGSGQLLDLVAAKSLEIEDPTQWLKSLERGAGADMRLRKTYQQTKLVRYNTTAPLPKVGLVFLPGASKPAVTRLEQSGMIDMQPDQRNSSWRVTTASALLASYTVNKRFELVLKNMTEDIIYRNLARHNTSAERHDTVTIDSQEVSLISEIKRDHYGQVVHDLSATLIEVDASSLMKLVEHFRHLVSQSKVQIVQESHASALGNMMEAARFFFSRSPILFRMGTRLHILDSVDIRYGIDDDHGFATIYPSRGIAEVLLYSESFFSAIDADDTQRHVRSRFLQMLVLLLSMLPNSDIQPIASFLWETYGIRADRTDLELLFLKVIPMSSINSKIFLKALIAAASGGRDRLPDSALHNEEFCWRVFLGQLATRGYLLPGTVSDLGHETHSWMVGWPQNGFHSNRVFGRLQHHGQSRSPLKGFNEILPMRVGPEPDMKEMTVYLYHSEKPYIVDVADYDPIQSQDPGRYILREADLGGKEVELRIKSESLNHFANTAIRKINEVIGRINEYQSRNSGKLIKLPFGRSQPAVPTIISKDIQTSAVISRHEAWLEDTNPYVAVAWKCDGRTISKHDMLNRMHRSANRVRAVLEWFERLTNGSFGKHDQQYRQVQGLLASHEAMIQRERSTRNGWADTPIRSTVSLNDEVSGVDPDIWFDYHSMHRPGSHYLHIKAQRDLVKSVHWIRDGAQAQVELAINSTKFVVAPLRPSPNSLLDDEVARGDLAILCGRYMIIAVPAVRQGRPVLVQNYEVYEMTNWLEIQRVEKEAQTQRGRNRAQAEVSTPETVFI